MKNKQIQVERWLSLLPVLLLFLSFSRCKDDSGGEASATYDPSKPVEVYTFTPDTGGVGTQMLIYGSNFGKDVSQITLLVNGKKAPVIGSNGEVIYALCPRRARDNEGSCDVKLQIGQGSQMQEKDLGRFWFIPHEVVSTLAGFTDEDGKTAIVDGAIEKAQFEDPFWMAFDEHKNIYMIEEFNGLRFIDAAKTEVKTKFRTGNGVGRPRTIAFTQHWDTMVIACDAGNSTDISQIILTRAQKLGEEDFSEWKAVHYSKQCNGGVFHPVHWDYYFNSYEAGQVYKVTNRNVIPWTKQELFKTGDVQWEFNIQFAPSGNFAYIVAVNQHYIARAEYDWDKHTLGSPVNFIGQRGRAGYADGSRDNALLNKPHQGAFDEDDNFYLCDARNQCIRKITPQGIVTTFAGRPTEAGYVDGELRDAQFYEPHGIIYDKDEKTFYIGDQKNHCIRMITTE